MKGVDDWLLANLTRFKDYVSYAEESERSAGVLQRIDVRAKIIGLTTLIAAAVAAHRLSVLLFTLAAALALAVASKIHPGILLRGIWIPVLLFTGLIALPAFLTTPGQTIVWGLTTQGIRAASFLVLRAETAATLAALAALTTSWPRLLKGFRSLGAPAVFTAILAGTYRYLFLLVETASQMSEARISRTVGALAPETKRRVAGATAGVLLTKSFELSSEVHDAMLSRGFRGDFFALVEVGWRTADTLWLIAFLGGAGAAFYLGR